MACASLDTGRPASRRRGSGDARDRVSAAGREALSVFKDLGTDVRADGRYRGARWWLHGPRCLYSADAGADRSGSRSPRRSYPRTTAIAGAVNGVAGRPPLRTLVLSRDRFASSAASRVCEPGGRKAAGRSGFVESVARRSSAGTRAIQTGRASALVRSTAIRGSGRAYASSWPTPRPGRPSRTMGCHAIRRAHTRSRAGVQGCVPAA
jgi:hypothetical protein